MELENLFGNRTSALLLPFLLTVDWTNSAHASKELGLPVTPVRWQIKKYLSMGILEEKKLGRMRLIRLNRNSPYFKPLRKMIRIAEDNSQLGPEKIMLLQKSKRGYFIINITDHKS